MQLELVRAASPHLDRHAGQHLAQAPGTWWETSFGTEAVLSETEAPKGGGATKPWEAQGGVSRLLI